MTRRARPAGPMAGLLLLVSLLVVPLAFLLFVQWPLREWLQAGSQLANDTAQILFAVYVAVAVTAASRANTHLAAGSTHRTGLWRASLLLVCVGPWVLFMLWAAKPLIGASVMGLERFGETMNPGYFVIKLALGLLLLLVLLDAVAGWLKAWRHNS